MNADKHHPGGVRVDRREARTICADVIRSRRRDGFTCITVRRARMWEFSEPDNPNFALARSGTLVIGDLTIPQARWLD